MQELVFVKLGGSLITDKRRDSHARHEVIRGLAESVSAALPAMREALLLGHGSGSFGHMAAIRHGFTGEEPPSALATAAVARAAGRLNGLVLDALLGAGVPAISWAPSSVLESRSGRRLSGGLGALERALEGGLVPVVYGDVVLDSQRRAVIASTEALVRHLESRLRRRGWRLSRLIWLGETKGIWDAGGQVVRRIDESNYRLVRRAAGGSAGADVTGGMLLRLDTAWQLARRGVCSLIADGRQPGLLAAALRGEDVPGTVVTARS